MLQDVEGVFLHPEEFEKYYFPSGTLELLKEMELLPDIFFLTGSAADGQQTPNDLDFFVRRSPSVRALCEKYFSLKYYEGYLGDGFVSQVWKSDSCIDLQIIHPSLLTLKRLLMRRFHRLMRSLEEYPSKRDRRLILQEM